MRGDEVMGIGDSDSDGEETVGIDRVHCEQLLSELRQRLVSSRIVRVRWTSYATERSNIGSTDIISDTSESSGT